MNSKAYRFEDLRVWKRAHELVLYVYQQSSTFPKNEMFGLTGQMRRAAVSTAANLAEGFRRRSNKDLCHFFNIAQASNEEVRYYFHLARDLGYIPAEIGQQGIESADIVSAMLYRFLQSTHDVS